MNSFTFFFLCVAKSTVVHPGTTDDLGAYAPCVPSKQPFLTL